MRSCLIVFIVIVVAIAILSWLISEITGIPQDDVTNFLANLLWVIPVVWTLYMFITPRGRRLLRLENMKNLRKARLQREAQDEYRRLQERNDYLIRKMKRALRKMKAFATDKEYDYEFESNVYTLPGYIDPIPIDAMVRDLDLISWDYWQEQYGQFVSDENYEESEESPDDETSKIKEEIKKLNGNNSVQIQVPRVLAPHLRTNFDQEDERRGYIDGLTDGINDYEDNGELSKFDSKGSPAYRKYYAEGYALTTKLPQLLEEDKNRSDEEDED